MSEEPLASRKATKITPYFDDIDSSNRPNLWHKDLNKAAGFENINQIKSNQMQLPLI